MQSVVFLIGFRGVGKTTVGKNLATILDYDFTDIDFEISKSEEKTIAEIVSESGWEGFRKIEKSTLLKCTGAKKQIISTGGGAVLHQNIWTQLKKDALVIWLTADVDIIKQRISNDSGSVDQRPCLRYDGADDIELILKERQPLYEKFGDVKIDTGLLTPGQTIKTIIDTLKIGDKC